MHKERINMDLKSLAKADCRLGFIIPYLKIGAIHREKWNENNE